MARDPAVLLYTSDFLTGITLLTDEQTGQYIKLLCHQHQIGHLPKNHMISVCGSYDSPVISKFIQDNDGLYYNERMEEEIEKRASYCASRSHKGKAGRKKKSHENHTKNIRKSHGNRIENENDNVVAVDKCELKKAFQMYEDMRIKIRKPFTVLGRDLAIKHLMKYANTNNCHCNREEMIEILERSISNGWQGLFPLDKRATGRSSANNKPAISEDRLQAYKNLG